MRWSALEARRLGAGAPMTMSVMWRDADTERVT
jgi:hypothetical protein